MRSFPTPVNPMGIVRTDEERLGGELDTSLVPTSLASVVGRNFLSNVSVSFLCLADILLKAVGVIRY